MAEPRRIGVDGKPLARSWRWRTERTVALARNARAARAQPRWPRIVGWCCIGVACLAATRPVEPVTRHVPVSAGGRPVPEVGNVVSLPAVGIVDGTFVWQRRDEATTESTLIVLGADYAEIVRADVTGALAWRPPAAVAEELGRQGTCHPVLLQEVAGQIRRSRLRTVTWN